VRINIYLPDDLADQVRQLTDVNVSAVCQQALKNEIARTGADVTKVDENRIRRMAQRQGLQLHKCRRRDPLSIGFGLYLIAGPSSTTSHAEKLFATGIGRTLDEVERALGGSRVSV